MKATLPRKRSPKKPRITRVTMDESGLGTYTGETYKTPSDEDLKKFVIVGPPPDED